MIRQFEIRIFHAIIGIGNMNRVDSSSKIFKWFTISIKLKTINTNSLGFLCVCVCVQCVCQSRRIIESWAYCIYEKPSFRNENSLTTFTIEIIHLTAEPSAEHPRLKKIAFQSDFNIDMFNLKISIFISNVD